MVFGKTARLRLPAMLRLPLLREITALYREFVGLVRSSVHAPITTATLPTGGDVAALDSAWQMRGLPFHRVGASEDEFEVSRGSSPLHPVSVSLCMWTQTNPCIFLHAGAGKPFARLCSENVGAATQRLSSVLSLPAAPGEWVGFHTPALNWQSCAICTSWSLLITFCACLAYL